MTLAAEEAGFVPVLVFIREILGVDSNNLVALLAGVCEHVLVAADAVRMVVTNDVPLSG